MRSSGVESLFVILGPSGAGKSSFLRAGLCRGCGVRTGSSWCWTPCAPSATRSPGTGASPARSMPRRTRLGLDTPTLGAIKDACTRVDTAQLQEWLAEARQAAAERLLEVPVGTPPPTLVLPLDQAEELFSADAGPQAPRFLELLAGLLDHEDGTVPALIVAATVRSDFYEPLQTAPELAGLKSVVFDELKPMPVARFREVILGPAARATGAGRPLEVETCSGGSAAGRSVQGADTLPLLSLTLARLYQDYGGDGDLRLAEYHAMGGMQQVVQHEIDTLLSPDPAVRQGPAGAAEICVHSLAGDHQPRQRPAGSPDRPPVRSPERRPATHRCHGGPAFVGRGRARRGDRDRSSSGEPAAPMAGSGRVAGQRAGGPQGGRQPGTRRSRLGTQRPQRGVALRRRKAESVPRHCSENPDSGNGWTLPASSSAPPEAGRRNGSQLRRDGRMPNYGLPATSRKWPKRTQRIYGNALAYSRSS